MEKNKEEYKAVNLHSHIERCQHAEGKPLDYAAEATRNHMSVLGISDHTPFPEKRDTGVRMTIEELTDYVWEIEEAQRQYPQLRILKALECDYTPEYLTFYQEIKERYQLDYLIGSVHFYLRDGEMISFFDEPIDHEGMKIYTDLMLANIDTEEFAFAAHPDLFCMNLETWDSYTEDCVKEICRMAEQKKKPLEINMNGYHRPGSPYPEAKFWKIAGEYEIETLINSDAHKIKNLCAAKEIGYQLQQTYHLRQWDYKGII